MNHHLRRTVPAVGAVLATGVAMGALGWAGGAQSAPSAERPLISRAAAGPVDAFGGARRETTDQTQLIQDSLAATGAKNVILLIGDGMGDSEITVARNYLEGAGGFFKGLDALPLTGQMTHYSVDKATGKPDYDPDSAATGTAWATGQKSYDGAISVNRAETPRQTLLEWAKQSGRATGDVTTAEIQDATPAVQVASVNARSCYGPDQTSTTCPRFAKENGGLGSITEQLLDTRPDVTLGGGSATFAQKAKAGTYAGKTLRAQAQQRGYNVINNAKQLKAVTRADQDAPLLGTFSQGNMPVKFAPLNATPTGADGDARTCTANPDYGKTPPLSTMTTKAIDLLSKNRAGTDKGFFLQVESASIDKQDHAANPCGQIGETEQLDQAVTAALDFARKDGNTLVITTADHAHTSQIVDAPTPGLNAKLRTREGSDMIVSYNTAPAGGSQQHTGTQLRVAGYGPGAGNLVGLIDQTDLHFIMQNAMEAFRG
ncbi:alkaline phosphatase [Marmoricola endophyticus]|uniref:Alkaline phosphatase n=1 Tax=Marmoricola endophyticus TaxID=2040280 RepID=A0A917F307_9ACTN|nr:alkaline phosphatase [Marmoricola endophyticus]GGF43557.1 alkaline phosphatase [Marmoricola endophyticus]